jgi:Tol biopolymer transport system component
LFSRTAGVVQWLLLVGLVACADNPDVATKKCAAAAPLQLVYTEYGVTDQESSRVMGLDHDGNEVRVVPEDDYAFRPAFSPDGSQVAFISRRLDTSEAASNFDLYVISSDGTGEHPVELRVTANDPSWSGDGDWILFVGNYASNDGGIFRIRPNGSGLESIIRISEPLRPHSPVFSPDGTQIAWAQWDVSDTSGTNVIRLANADGSNVRTLTELDGVEELDWSPDGETLATSSFGPDGQSVYLVEVETGDVERVAEDAMGAKWNAQGTELYYTAGPESEEPRLVARDMESGEERPVSKKVPQSFNFRFDIDPLPCLRE